MKIIILFLIALKIAGIGQFSWWLPVGLSLLYAVVKVIAWQTEMNKIGKDWHSGMFE